MRKPTDALRKMAAFAIIPSRSPRDARRSPAENAARHTRSTAGAHGVAATACAGAPRMGLFRAHSEYAAYARGIAVTMRTGLPSRAPAAAAAAENRATTTSPNAGERTASDVTQAVTRPSPKSQFDLLFSATARFAAALSARTSPPAREPASRAWRSPKKHRRSPQK